MGSNGSSLSGTISYKINEELLNPAEIISPNSQLNFYSKREINISNPSLNTKENTSASDEERTSFTFEWNEPCEKVQITGDFNNWQAVNMHQNPSTGFFEYRTILTKNAFYFKFIVDGSKWRCSDNYPIEKDNYNNVNNYINLATTDDSTKKISKAKNNVDTTEKKPSSDYSCNFPKIGDLDDRVPKIPDLLKKEFNFDKDIQNNLLFKNTKNYLDEKVEIDKNDCYRKLISVPHDKLNHLFLSTDYCKIKQYSKCIITQRFKRKLTTFVYYTAK